jgi:hypothetical protein
LTIFFFLIFIFIFFYYSVGKNEVDSVNARAFIANSTQYIRARGLPVNSFSLNGIVVESADLQSSLMNTLGREQFILSQYVGMRVITGYTSISECAEMTADLFR